MMSLHHEPLIIKRNQYACQFKNKTDITMTLGELYRILNVDPATYSSFNGFKQTVLDRPLKKIIKVSNGMWQVKEGYPKGYIITRKQQRTQVTDKITFKMHYTEPSPLEDSAKPLSPAQSSVQSSAPLLTVEQVFKTLTEAPASVRSFAELGIDQRSAEHFWANLMKPDNKHMFGVMPRFMPLSGSPEYDA